MSYRLNKEIHLALAGITLAGVFYTTDADAQVCDANDQTRCDVITVYFGGISDPPSQDPYYGPGDPWSWCRAFECDMGGGGGGSNPKPPPAPQPPHDCKSSTSYSAPFTQSQANSWNSSMTAQQNMTTAMLGYALGTMFGPGWGVAAALISQNVQYPYAQCGHRLTVKSTVCPSTYQFFDGGGVVPVGTSITSASLSFVNHGDTCVDDTIIQPPPVCTPGEPCTRPESAPGPISSDA